MTDRELAKIKKWARSVMASKASRRLFPFTEAYEVRVTRKGKVLVKALPYASGCALHFFADRGLDPLGAVIRGTSFNVCRAHRDLLPRFCRRVQCSKEVREDRKRRIG